jgi:hypothetical protein
VVVELDPHTVGVRDALEAADLVVGVAEAPEGGGWQGAPGASPFVAYVVVWPQTTILDGTLAEAEIDGAIAYQLSAWAATREGAERTADLARVAVKDTTVTGRHVIRVAHDVGMGVTRDDTLQPPLFHARDRYRIETTPT